ncbi:unnamed protein product [Clavelina lepadiformis]|uniref:Uncharacterized protein n=1 Tax=Clavelina lepadiformis TaxID=159417 RepID=A0ABP0FYB1_CLALP
MKASQSYTSRPRDGELSKAQWFGDFTTRTSATNSYKAKLEGVIQNLIDRRAIELVEKEEHLHFPNASKETFPTEFVVRKL